MNILLLISIGLGVLLVLSGLLLVRAHFDNVCLNDRIEDWMEAEQDLRDDNLTYKLRIESMRKEILELRGKVSDQEDAFDMWQSLAYDAFLHMRQSSTEIQSKALRIDNFVKSVPGGWGQQPQCRSVIEDSTNG